MAQARKGSQLATLQAVLAALKEAMDGVDFRPLGTVAGVISARADVELSTIHDHLRALTMLGVITQHTGKEAHRLFGASVRSQTYVRLVKPNAEVAVRNGFFYLVEPGSD